MGDHHPGKIHQCSGAIAAQDRDCLLPQALLLAGELVQQRLGVGAVGEQFGHVLMDDLGIPGPAEFGVVPVELCQKRLCEPRTKQRPVDPDGGFEAAARGPQVVDGLGLVGADRRRKLAHQADLLDPVPLNAARGLRHSPILR